MVAFNICIIQVVLDENTHKILGTRLQIVPRIRPGKKSKWPMYGVLKAGSSGTHFLKDYSIGCLNHFQKLLCKKEGLLFFLMEH